MKYFTRFVQYVLSKCFPFKDINSYDKDQTVAKMAGISVCKNLEDMKPKL